MNLMFICLSFGLEFVERVLYQMFREFVAILKIIRRNIKIFAGFVLAINPCLHTISLSP